jgi:hypothetical protein
MSYELLEQAAAELGPLLDKVAFLGGASLVLWVSDQAAAPIRVTQDVDVIAEVGSTVQYYKLGEELRAQGFEEDPARRVTCAWRHRRSELKLDVMPTDPDVLGFSNEWYRPALVAAEERRLPSGAAIRAVTPAHLLATKIEAFRGRGRGDYLASRDFGDIIVLVDGRPELVDEVRAAPSELRRYLAAQLDDMKSDLFFPSGLSGALLPDRASQARAPLVHERIDAIIAASA